MSLFSRDQPHGRKFTQPVSDEHKQLHIKQPHALIDDNKTEGHRSNIEQLPLVLHPNLNQYRHIDQNTVQSNVDDSDYTNLTKTNLHNAKLKKCRVESTLPYKRSPYRPSSILLYRDPTTGKFWSTTQDKLTNPNIASLVKYSLQKPVRYADCRRPHQKRFLADLIITKAHLKPIIQVIRSEDIANSDYKYKFFRVQPYRSKIVGSIVLNTPAFDYRKNEQFKKELLDVRKNVLTQKFHFTNEPHTNLNQLGYTTWVSQQEQKPSRNLYYIRASLPELASMMVNKELTHFVLNHIKTISQPYSLTSNNYANILRQQSIQRSKIDGAINKLQMHLQQQEDIVTRAHDKVEVLQSHEGRFQIPAFFDTDAQYNSFKAIQDDPQGYQQHKMETQLENIEQQLENTLRKHIEDDSFIPLFFITLARDIVQTKNPFDPRLCSLSTRPTIAQSFKTQLLTTRGALLPCHDAKANLANTMTNQLSRLFPTHFNTRRVFLTHLPADPRLHGQHFLQLIQHGAKSLLRTNNWSHIRNKERTGIESAQAEYKLSSMYFPYHSIKQHKIQPPGYNDSHKMITRSQRQNLLALPPGHYFDNTPTNTIAKIDPLYDIEHIPQQPSARNRQSRLRHPFLTPQNLTNAITWQFPRLSSSRQQQRKFNDCKTISEYYKLYNGIVHRYDDLRPHFGLSFLHYQTALCAAHDDDNNDNNNNNNNNMINNNINKKVSGVDINNQNNYICEVYKYKPTGNEPVLISRDEWANQVATMMNKTHKLINDLEIDMLENYNLALSPSDSASIYYRCFPLKQVLDHFKEWDTISTWTKKAKSTNDDDVPSTFINQNTDNAFITAPMAQYRYYHLLPHGFDIYLREKQAHDRSIGGVLGNLFKTRTTIEKENALMNAVKRVYDTINNEFVIDYYQNRQQHQQHQQQQQSESGENNANNHKLVPIFQLIAHPFTLCDDLSYLMKRIHNVHLDEATDQKKEDIANVAICQQIHHNHCHHQYNDCTERNCALATLNKGTSLFKSPQATMQTHGNVITNDNLIDIPLDTTVHTKDSTLMSTQTPKQQQSSSSTTTTIVTPSTQPETTPTTIPIVTTLPSQLPPHRNPRLLDKCIEQMKKTFTPDHHNIPLRHINPPQSDFNKNLYPDLIKQSMQSKIINNKTSLLDSSNNNINNNNNNKNNNNNNNKANIKTTSNVFNQEESTLFYPPAPLRDAPKCPIHLTRPITQSNITVINPNDITRPRVDIQLSTLEYIPNDPIFHEALLEDKLDSASPLQSSALGGNNRNFFPNFTTPSSIEYGTVDHMDDDSTHLYPLQRQRATYDEYITQNKQDSVSPLKRSVLSDQKNTFFASFTTPTTIEYDDNKNNITPIQSNHLYRDEKVYNEYIEQDKQDSVSPLQQYSIFTRDNIFRTFTTPSTIEHAVIHDNNIVPTKLYPAQREHAIYSEYTAQDKQDSISPLQRSTLNKSSFGSFITPNTIEAPQPVKTSPSPSTPHTPVQHNIVGTNNTNHDDANIRNNFTSNNLETENVLRPEKVSFNYADDYDSSRATPRLSEETKTTSFATFMTPTKSQQQISQPIPQQIPQPILEHEHTTLQKYPEQHFDDQKAGDDYVFVDVKPRVSTIHTTTPRGFLPSLTRRDDTQRQRRKRR